MERISVKENFTVNTYDIDAAGHVNNAVYINWLEQLRTKLFDDLFGFGELMENNLFPVVVKTEIEYKAQVGLFDEPVGKMYVDSYRHGLYFLKGEIKTGACVNTLIIQKCTFMDLQKRKMVKLPPPEKTT